MKAIVRANSLSAAMKTCMQDGHSPRLIFNDDGLSVSSQVVEAIAVEGDAESHGWSHLEYPRAEKVVQVLDLLGENWVTISYHNGRHFTFENLMF